MREIRTSGVARGEDGICRPLLLDREPMLVVPLRVLGTNEVLS